MTAYAFVSDLFSTMLSWSVHVENGRISFFSWLNTIPSHNIRILHLLYPFIHWWPLMLLPSLGCRESCCNKHGSAHISLNSCLHFLWVYTHPEVGFLDHTVVLFLTFWGTSVLFPIRAEPTYFPPTVHKRCLVSMFSPTLTSSFLQDATLAGASSQHTVALTPISLMSSGAEYFFMHLLAICMSSSGHSRFFTCKR